MKGRKDWKKRWFSLRGFTLYYYENESAERCEGFVDLNKGCEVVRQKALKEANAKQWPLKIVVGGDRKLFVRAPSKRDRHSWFLFLSSKIAHMNYLKALSPQHPDSRLVTLFISDLVTDLYLDDKVISDPGAIALAKTLPAHDETKVISLSNTGLTDQALSHVSGVVGKSNVTSLHLSKNNLTSGGISGLASALAQNNTLTSLDLSDNKIDDSGIVALSEALSSKVHLAHLNLSGNNYGKGGAEALLKAFGSGEHAALTQLQLARNQLGDEGASTVSQLISTNHTVNNVNLSGNKISDNGSIALANSLASNESEVTSIDLSNNNIGEKGALALSNAFDSNKSLIELNLSNNNFKSGGNGLTPLFKEGVSFPHLHLVR